MAAEKEGARTRNRARAHSVNGDSQHGTCDALACQVAPPVAPAGLVLRPDAEPPAQKFATLLKSARKFRGAWERMPHRDDWRAREYDAELAGLICQAPGAWSDQELLNLLVASRRIHGDDPETLPYFRDVIRDARSTHAAVQQATKVLREIDAGVGVETPAAKLATLRDVLQLPLARVVQRVRKNERSEFALVLDSGEQVTVGGAEDMLSRRRIRAIVAGSAGRIIPLLKQWEWDKLAQLLVEICEVEQLPEDCTEHGEVRVALAEYLSRTTLLREGPDGEHPFIRDGAVYFVGSHFREWCRLRRLGDLSGKQFGRVMGLLNVRSEVVYMDLKVQGRTTRNCWRLPPGFTAGGEP